MQHLTFKRKAQLLIILSAITLTMGCVKSGYNEAVVYNSNFKTGATDKLTGAILYKNNGEYLIGRYNKSGFTISLENLPAHCRTKVS
jgi:hypothetical protein